MHHENGELVDCWVPVREAVWVLRPQEGFDNSQHQASSPLRLAPAADCATVPRSQNQAVVWCRVKPRDVCVRLATAARDLQSVPMHWTV